MLLLYILIYLNINIKWSIKYIYLFCNLFYIFHSLLILCLFVCVITNPPGVKILFLLLLRMHCMLNVSLSEFLNQFSYINVYSPNPISVSHLYFKIFWFITFSFFYIHFLSFFFFTWYTFSGLNWIYSTIFKYTRSKKHLNLLTVITSGSKMFKIKLKY